jgi:hypothetical protein
MTHFMIDHLAHRTRLVDPVEAGAVFDDAVQEILPHGGCGQTLWFGSGSAEPELRIDIDVEADRAAVTWLPDATVGVEREPGPPITVMTSLDEPLTAIPAQRARVGAVTARQLVIEYVTTGTKPNAVAWTSMASAS